MSIKYFLFFSFLLFFGCKQKEIEKPNSASKSATITPVFNEFSVSRYGPRNSLIREVYRNGVLVSKYCSRCNNNYVECFMCLGTGKGNFKPKYIHVDSYVNKYGTVVKSHYRTAPGTMSRCESCKGYGKVICDNCQ